jgi:hypothetical protein
MTDRIIAAGSGGAGISGPWGGAHPVSWALATDRITQRSAPAWLARYVADQATTGATLASLYPVVGASRIAASGTYAVEDADPYYALYGDDGTSGQPQPVAASFRAGSTPEVDASPARDTTIYRNAVEELRASQPGLIRAAERGGPPPGMFGASGDYPLVTASGTDPALLRALPWRARIAATWARDPAEVARIITDCADDPLAAWELNRHPEVQDYIGKVEFWARNSGLQQEIEQAQERMGRQTP